MTCNVIRISDVCRNGPNLIRQLIRFLVQFLLLMLPRVMSPCYCFFSGYLTKVHQVSRERNVSRGDTFYLQMEISQLLASKCQRAVVLKDKRLQMADGWWSRSEMFSVTLSWRGRGSCLPTHGWTPPSSSLLRMWQGACSILSTRTFVRSAKLQSPPQVFILVRCSADLESHESSRSSSP